MHLFTYRGLRVHKFYRHIRVITSFLMLSPFLIGNGFYYYPIYDLIIVDPLFYLPKIYSATHRDNSDCQSHSLPESPLLSAP